MSTAGNSQLSHHQWDTYTEDKKQIDQHKGAAAIFTSHVRESPQVSKAH